MHIGKNLKKRLERGVLIFLIIEGIVFFVGFFLLHILCTHLLSIRDR